MPIKISNVFLNEQDCSGVHLTLFFLRISGNSENRTPDILVEWAQIPILVEWARIPILVEWARISEMQRVLRLSNVLQSVVWIWIRIHFSSNGTVNPDPLGFELIRRIRIRINKSDPDQKQIGSDSRFLQKIVRRTQKFKKVIYIGAKILGFFFGSEFKSVVPSQPFGVKPRPKFEGAYRSGSTQKKG